MRQETLRCALLCFLVFSDALAAVWRTDVVEFRWVLTKEASACFSSQPHGRAPKSTLETRTTLLKAVLASEGPWISLSQDSPTPSLQTPGLRLADPSPADVVSRRLSETPPSGSFPGPSGAKTAGSPKPRDALATVWRTDVDLRWVLAREASGCFSSQLH
ncbi:hypothetical protein H920_07280 [Fukomys damarensis]|uniref:Uncharacterized protein n=1 Tax=Fukomys damarensis TaxID=885580 RepID=A0A091DM49_FUKDA|nr:hypothetical protein H920_07280 [Fukomys damarensis]